MLEDQSFGGDVVLVGDDANLQGEVLLRAESGGGRDEVGGESACEEVARGTTDEQEKGDETESQFIAHA